MVLQRCEALRATATRFLSAREGNVAMMFAIALVPLIVATGGVVDYSRIAMTRTELQDAADATATMLSKSAPGMTDTQMQQAAEDYFNANFNASDSSTPVVTASYSPSGPTVSVTASTTVQTYFLPIIGLGDVPIDESSTVVWGGAHLRVALVLDNTGSMKDDGKMTALKTASKNLLDKLKAAAFQDGDVYVSIIPFSKDVNAGPTNYTQSWLRWDLWDEVNGACSSSGGWGWGWGWGSPSYYHDKTSCEHAGYKWTANSHTSWNGCVTDRDQSYDVANDAPTSTSRSFPAEQYSYCPVELMGLSYDWNTLSDKISSMQPDGNTNQAIGLQWGWQSLTQSPFTIPAYDPQYQYKLIIILLTDGMNTEDRWSTNSSYIDGREATLCNNIKATGVSIFTVQVNTGHDPTSQMLKDCASSSDQTFLLTSADQIITTFDQIGTTLSQLRISK